MNPPPQPEPTGGAGSVQDMLRGTIQGGSDRVRPFPLPEVAPAVARLLEQPYLTEHERSEARVRHGIWEAADVSSPRARARVALLAGNYAAPELRGDAAAEGNQGDLGADPLDVIEAAVLMGEPERALVRLEALEGASRGSMRAMRLWAQALLDTGKARNAEEMLAALATAVQRARPDDADEAAQAGRGLILLARLRGAEGPGTVGYQQQLDALGDARDRLDRLAWQPLLTEALLLFEKDKYEESLDALQSLLSLNPRCAEAWLLLGRIYVQAMEFERVERIAARLDALAATPLDASPETDVPDPPPSLLGSLLRAQLRMRQVEGAMALRELEPAARLAPSQREVLSMRAAATALSFDLEGARRVLAELDALAPRFAGGYMASGLALASARQYEDAADFLREASARAPLWAEPLFELGLSELQAGRLDEARTALNKGLRLDRFNVRAQNSQVLLKELEGYTTLESEHFIVRYKPGVDEIMARDMLEPLERTFLRVTGDGPGGIRHVPSHKTTIELYPNHRWFATRITGLPALHTFAAATGPVIAMEVPRSGAGHKVGPYDWARVVQHEYVHTVTLSKTRNRLPHWFTEASAVFLEDAPIDFGTVQLLTQAWRTGGFFDFDTINIMFARPRKPTDRAQAYAQGAEMYAYIIDRWGNEAPLELMRLYATGVREEEAFEQVLKVPRAQFLEDFTLWFEQRLQDWGMAPRPGEPTLDTLLGEAGLDEPTQELLERWRNEHRGNPFVLEALVRRLSERGEQALTSADIPVLEEYARARSVDPLPHKLLASLFLSGREGLDPARAIPHLQFLDAREQNSPAYAFQLARQFAGAGRLDEAMLSATRATQISPYDAGIREEAARIALLARRLDVAERHLWALTKLEPDRARHQQRLDAVRGMRATESPAPGVQDK